MRSVVLFFVALMFVVSCADDTPTAQEIVDASIESAGGTFRTNKMINFKFRDKFYKSIIKSDGTFHYERSFKDSIYHYRDILSNQGLKSYINDSMVTLPDSMASRYSASVNSVHYFAQLPYGLNAPAVNKKKLANETINGIEYYKVEVTFNQDGGGEDFEDVFIYWIDTKSNNVDFLAYSYNEDDGLGLRFREAYNERYINNIRFVDYNNFKPKDESAKLTDLALLFQSDGLQLLSKIETENVIVNQLVDNN